MNTQATFPYAAPSWLTPKRILYPAVLLFIGCATLPVVWQINLARNEIRDSTIASIIVLLCTTSLSLLLLWRALRARAFDRTLLWCIFVAMPLGALNSGLSVALVALSRGQDSGQIFGGLLLGFLIGGFIAAPIGLVYGILYSIVAGATKSALQYPSHDGPDRLMIITGLWLGILGVMIWNLPASPYNWISPLWMIMGGPLVAGVGLYRFVARKRWYERVLQDKHPRYKLIEPEDQSPSAWPDLKPLFRAEPPLDGEVKVLMYLPPARDIAYRDAPKEIPVALLGIWPKTARVVEAPVVEAA